MTDVADIDRTPEAARARRSGAVALAAAIGIVVMTLTGLALLSTNRGVVYGNDYVLWGIFTATTAAYAVSGYAIVRRVPGNPIGWLSLGLAATLEGGLGLTQYGLHGAVAHRVTMPGAAYALAVAEATPILVLTGIALVVHLFPTGRPISRRWVPFVVLTAVGGLGAALGNALTRHRIVDIWSDELSHAGVAVRDPLGVVPRTAADPVIGAVLAGCIAIGAVGAVASILVRRRRAEAEERQQLRWLTAVCGATLVWILLSIPLLTIFDPNGPAGAVFWLVATPLVALGPPLAIGLGIVRYRLFDIEVVIRKTVIVTVVVAALLTVYLGVLALATVGVVSRLIVGIALLLITFNPVRRAATSIADRVAYGRRASSYEILSGFSRRMAEAYASDDVLERMASILANGTGARSATVWLRIGGALRPEATAGEPGTLEPVPLDRDELPELDGESAEVRHDGELLGALSVVMPPNDPIDPARRALVADLASQAGLVLRNVRLIEELRGSRQRLVAAQDQERRRIERNIHDGAQQQLVALAVKLRLADQLVGRDEDKAHVLLTQLQSDAQDALDDLRDLARGIYPPLLADKGLVAAVEAQARKSPLPVSVQAENVGRAGQDVEAAAYFCVLEALQNASKYANASSVTVRLARENGSLRFSVGDDGIGFDPADTPPGSGLTNMRDRLEALGGSVDVRSGPGGGTRVSGHIPIPQGSAS
jgi:signal transduction histidine kinase